MVFRQYLGAWKSLTVPALWPADEHLPPRNPFKRSSTPRKTSPFWQREGLQIVSVYAKVPRIIIFSFFSVSTNAEVIDPISSIHARLPHYITKANTQKSVVGVQPFCRNKNHPDKPKREALACGEKRFTKLCVDTGSSAVSALHDREIMNASINNDAVNMNTCQQCRIWCGFITSSTVKWNLGFGSLSRLSSPGFSDPFPWLIWSPAGCLETALLHEYVGQSPRN